MKLLPLGFLFGLVLAPQMAPSIYLMVTGDISILDGISLLAMLPNDLALALFKL